MADALYDPDLATIAHELARIENQNGEKKTGVVVFFDLVGSTKMKLKLGHREAVRATLLHNGIARKVVDRMGGVTNKEMGDGIIAEFQDAVEACRALLNVRRAVELVRLPHLQTRAGAALGTYEVLPIDGRVEILGDAVDRAARICAVSRPGQLLIDAGLWRAAFTHLRDFDDVLMCDGFVASLKGIDPLVLYELSDDTLGLVGARPDVLAADYDLARTTRLTYFDGSRLRYCGYAVDELAERATHEEVSYLLLYRALPTGGALADHCSKIADGYRACDTSELEWSPDLSHNPYSRLILRWAWMAEGKPPSEDNGMLRAAHLLGRFLFALQQAAPRPFGQSHPTSHHPNLSGYAKFVLDCLGSRRPYPPQAVREFERLLILYADHGTASSTFVSRTAASGLLSLEHCVLAALIAFRSPYHGSASERVARLLQEIGHPGQARRVLEERLGRERIPGFGHRMYQRIRDPRTDVARSISKRLSEILANTAGHATHWHNIAAKVEHVGMTLRLPRGEPMPPANVDLFHGAAFLTLGLPIESMTMCLAAARVAGWLAHALEEHSGGAMIRPIPTYKGPMPRPFVALGERR